MRRSRVLNVGMILCIIVGIGVGWGWGCQPMPPDEEKTKQESVIRDGGSESVTEPSSGETVTPEQTSQDERTPDAVQHETDPTEQAPDAGPAPDVVIKTAIIVPTSFSPSTLTEQSWTLPTSFRKAVRLHFVLHAGVTPMVGAASGLFELHGKTLKRVDSTPVVGLIRQGAVVVVASANEIRLWDGRTLAPTRISKHLKGDTITALEYQAKDAFWLGTQKALWLYAQGQLQSFPAIKGVKRILAQPLKKLVLIEDLQGRFSALHQVNDTWRLRAFSAEKIPLHSMAPQAGTTINFWAMDQKKDLWLRKAKKSEAAWWMYRLKPDTDDRETVDVRHMLYQRKEEQTWIVAANVLYRLSESNVLILKRPNQLKKILHLGSTLDGSMWLSDGMRLFRIASKVVQLSYAKDIAPILKTSCLGCHKAGGRASFAPFTTYQEVKNRGALIAQRIEGKGGSVMPPKQALSSDKIAKIKAWVSGGMQP